MGYYLDESINDNKFNENLVNDIEYLGDFNKGYDYSSIIQVKNKICKIKKFLIQNIILWLWKLIMILMLKIFL